MASSRDSIRDVSGERKPHFGPWPVRIDERTADNPEQWVQSACGLCGVGCALDIAVKQWRIVGVRGRAEDRVNRGRLPRKYGSKCPNSRAARCPDRRARRFGPKGLNAWEANHNPDRLTTPLLREDGRLREVTWDEAMDVVVRRARQIRDDYTSSAIAFYTSGQLLLEEYYTLAIIARAGFGTPHLDANTRLSSASATMALIESFGCDGAPGSWSDLDMTDALFMVGHDMASTQTVLWSRVLDRLAGPNRPTSSSASSSWRRSAR